MDKPAQLAYDHIARLRNDQWELQDRLAEPDADYCETNTEEWWFRQGLTEGLAAAMTILEELGLAEVIIVRTDKP